MEHHRDGQTQTADTFGPRVRCSLRLGSSADLDLGADYARRRDGVFFLVVLFVLAVVSDHACSPTLVHPTLVAECSGVGIKNGAKGLGGVSTMVPRISIFVEVKAVTSVFAEWGGASRR